jgi:hypothetical protein
MASVISASLLLLSSCEAQRCLHWQLHPCRDPGAAGSRLLSCGGGGGADDNWEEEEEQLLQQAAQSYVDGFGSMLLQLASKLPCLQRLVTIAPTNLPSIEELVVSGARTARPALSERCAGAGLRTAQLHLAAGSGWLGGRVAGIKRPSRPVLP